MSRDRCSCLSGAGSERTGRESRSSCLAVLVMNMLVYPLLILQILLFTILAPAVLPLSVIIARRPLPEMVRFFIWVYGRLWFLIMSPFVSFRKSGLSEDRFPKPCIIVINHLSFFDIFCMGALPFSNVVFTVRAWPFRMFWYAPFMRLAGYVDMETLGLEKALKRCQHHLEQNASIVFFPEGHRSRDGKLGRFYSGAFKLSTRSGVPVVPVCITGTDQLLPPGRLVMSPAVVGIQALEAVSPANYAGETAHADMRKQIKKLMTEAISTGQSKVFL